MSDLPRTLFVGIGVSAVAWYRAALPAMALGCDWAGVRGTPAGLKILTGNVPTLSVADFHDYDVVVLQQPRGKEWVALIRSLQASGTSVLFEIDDLIEAARKAVGYDSHTAFDRAWVRDTQMAMRVCDGVICSTPYLARRYASFNERVSVCRNGLDLRRYAVTRTEHPLVTIGWAGATGHQRAIEPWLPGLREVMRARPATRFMTIGQRFADDFADEFGPERAISIPFGMIEAYPAAMANFDIALAPAANTNFFRAKSDLRWLEASAVGLPVIADPGVYPDIEHGVTGFHAATPAEAAALMADLVDDRELRERVGAQARDEVRATRSIEVMSEQWRDVLVDARATAAVA